MTKIRPDKLLISEHFYSVQGEGITSGVPAYFIRLTHCNLFCGATPKFVNRLKKGEIELQPGGDRGDLHESGRATWTCDTIPVWIRGREYEFQEIIDSWKEQGIYQDILTGLIHIIWTGGEPTIPGHQVSIVNFMEYWMKYEKEQQGYTWDDDHPIGIFDYDNFIFQPFNEIETNGTIVINDDLMEILDQINCSPKLSNSGQPKNQRIVPTALDAILYHSKYQFKFVISSEDDIFEMFDTYITPFDIPLNNVVCMPGLDDQANFFERTQWVMEMAKKYKFIGLTRLHVAAWDKTTGV